MIDVRAAAGSEAHILVVDDDARLRHLLQRFLAEHGFRVTTADTARDAREKLRIMTPDAMVLDVAMPGESGLSLTQSLRTETGSPPVLLLTARGAPEDRIAGFEAGADDYIGKPFEPYELVLRLRALLRRTAPTACGRATSAAPGSAQLRPRTCRAIGSVGGRASDRWRGGTAAGARPAPGRGARPGGNRGRTGHGRQRERAIDVQVTRLRRKLEADPREPRFLHTVRGRGYVLKPGV